MFGGGDDDDGDFVTVPSGSNLASLFGGGGGGGGGGQGDAPAQNNFQFHAPKQPRKGQHGTATQPQKPPTDAPAVMSTAVVQTYMYVNGQYASRGKLGLALLGNPDAKDYKLLLYGQQRKTVTSARVHAAFAFSVQANNYASFYDDQRQNWSIMFDNEQVASDFSTQVCLAKWQAKPGEQAGVLLLQDLRPGEGQAVEAGDNLEVEYTGWLLQAGGALGEVFDSNVGKDKMMRLKLGKGKVIKGWEQGMLGMCKGARRLLLVPPALAYGAQGSPPRIPPNTPLAFRVEIKRVKFAREIAAGTAGEPRDAHSPSPVPSQGGTPPLPTTLAAPQAMPPTPGSEDSVKSRSHSLSEQLTSQPDSVKARLISRMARMGQPLLPVSGAAPTLADTSDSELDGEGGGTPSGGPRTPEPQPRSAPTHPPSVAPVAGKQPVPAFRTLVQPPPAQQHQHHQQHHHHQQTVALPLAQPYQVWPDAGFMYGQVPAAPVPAPAYSAPFPGTGDVTSFLMTEARQHNTEVRLAVAKVADKMELLQSKVDDMHRLSVSQGLPQAGLASINLDAAMIMQNITRILQENERLKQEVLERSGRIEQQNEKISDLLQRNQRYAEQSNLLLEQRNDSFKNSTEQSQGRVLALEQDKSMDTQARLTEALAHVTSQLTGAQSQLSSNQAQEREVRGQLEGARAEAETRRAEVATLGEELSALREELRRVQESSRGERATLHAERLRSQALDDEVAGLHAERDALQSAALERKRRSEEQLAAFREQLRGAPQAEELSALRCERDALLADSGALRGERDELRGELARALAQLTESSERASESEGKEAQLWQEKYADLRRKAAEMRRGFEERLAHAATVTRDAGHTDTLTEVKKVMNGVFRSLRSEFTLEGTYSGRMILATVMNTIKATTLSLFADSEHPPHETAAAAAGPAPETSEPGPSRPPPTPVVPGTGASSPPERDATLTAGEAEQEDDDEEKVVVEVMVESVEVVVGKAVKVEEVEEVEEEEVVEMEEVAKEMEMEEQAEATPAKISDDSRSHDLGSPGPPIGDGATTESPAGAPDGSEDRPSPPPPDRPAAERERAPDVVVVTVAGEGSPVPERSPDIPGKPTLPPSSAGNHEEEEVVEDQVEDDGNLFSFVAPDKKVSRDGSASPTEKPGPPPLFGDEEDDDDVDWLK